MLWKLAKEATSQSALQHDTAFSTVELASMKPWYVSRFGSHWQLISHPGWGIVEPFKQLLRVTTNPQYSGAWLASTHGRLPRTLRYTTGVLIRFCENVGVWYRVAIYYIPRYKITNPHNHWNILGLEISNSFAAYLESEKSWQSIHLYAAIIIQIHLHPAWM